MTIYGYLVPNLVPPRPDLVPPSSRTRLATPLTTSSPRPLPYGGRGTRSRGSKVTKTTPTSSPIMGAPKSTQKAAQSALPIATPAPTPRAEDSRGMPAWLRRQLVENGVIALGHTRSARVSKCRKCGARVVSGWTDEPCAILATCDPHPLSNLGEVVALLQSRMTFDLARRAGRYELDLREQDHIAGSPPETPNSWRARADVLAAHRCHSEPLPTIESRIP